MHDLAELDEQVESGDIDATTADELRATYTAEADRAETALASLAEPDERRPLLTPRSLAGVAILLVSIAVAAFAVTQIVNDDTPTGIVSDALTGVDLNDVSDEDLEARVAADPDAVELRLALARRYVNAGEFQLALPHYLTVLQDGENAEALAYLGWMDHLSGAPEDGEALVQRGLAVDDDNPLALAILAVIRLDGLNDPSGAREALDRLSANPNLPDELRVSVEEMRARTETGS
jgi:tetratricopeptide (TPR) repeat protein